MSMSHQSKIISWIGFALLLIVIVGVATDHANSKKTVAMTTTAATTKSASATSTAASATNYKDGTYTATGIYNSPGGDESIKITITLASNVVTSTSAISESNPDTPISSVYQSQFIGAYKTLVVGKKITHITAKNVGGSSLTALGYNSAVDQIEKQAAA
jgi:uncharacterized protein with FMN-binding domain